MISKGTETTHQFFVTILDGMNLSGLMGTRLLLGYGTGADEMLAAQRCREIYVVQPEPAQ